MAEAVARPVESAKDGTRARNDPHVFRMLTFAAANTVAVLGALYIAFALDLERPYWAMFTVFIVANPIAGAVRSKAVYRFLGTLAGGALSLLLVPPLVQAPVLLCLATSLWVGACLYFSLLDRTPRSYAFLLAGYTATIVGLAVVNAPETIFDTTVSRIEEISLGLICSAIAHSVIFPQSVTVELNRMIQVTLSTAGAWLSGALKRPEIPPDALAQQQLATVVTELHVLYTHVDFEISDVPRAGGAMRVLQERLAVLLPRLSAIQKTLTALAALGQVPDSLTRALDDTSRWLRYGESPQPIFPYQGEATPPLERPVVVSEGTQTSVAWQALLEQSAISNLRELVNAVADSKVLATALTDDGAQLPIHLQCEAAATTRHSLHRDLAIALLSGVAGAGATLVACLLWIEGSWPEGAVAAQFAAIGCSLAATLDHPAKFIKAAIVGILLALPIAALYEFAILPRIDGFASLALVLTPAIALFSLMQSSKRLGGAGLIVAVAFSGGLALQSTYTADFAAFVNSNAAEIVGLLVAVAISLVFRTIDPTWNASRICRAGRRSVSDLAVQRRIDLRSWIVEMFDRLGLVTSRINAVGTAQSAYQSFDVLRDLRVGLNLGTLRDAAQELDPGHCATEDVLTAVSRAYRFAVINRRAQSDVELSIDRAIGCLSVQKPSSVMQARLAALIGLRLDLAPAIGPYTFLGNA